MILLLLLLLLLSVVERTSTFSTSITNYKDIDCKGENDEGDHNLIAKHKALLPIFQDDNGDHSESNMDVGVEADEEE